MYTRKVACALPAPPDPGKPRATQARAGAAKSARAQVCSSDKCKAATWTSGHVTATTCKMTLPLTVCGLVLQCVAHENVEWDWERRLFASAGGRALQPCHSRHRAAAAACALVSGLLFRCCRRRGLLFCWGWRGLRWLDQVATLENKHL